MHPLHPKLALNPTSPCNLLTESFKSGYTTLLTKSPESTRRQMPHRRGRPGTCRVRGKELCVLVLRVLGLRGFCCLRVSGLVMRVSGVGFSPVHCCFLPQSCNPNSKPCKTYKPYRLFKPQTLKTPSPYCWLKCNAQRFRVQGLQVQSSKSFARLLSGITTIVISSSSSSKCSRRCLGGIATSSNSDWIFAPVL